ncbi:MAG: ribonuclease Z [Bacteroidaceae bacterium]|nr:ribonuclease Z [Bacteroidaceae bacterium]
MQPFKLTILGCGSATPTLRHKPSAQVLQLANKLYLIDCGEGTQLQLRKSKINFSSLNAIFISHLHGDHCLGLPGLLSTLALLGRKSPLSIYAPVGASSILLPVFDFFCKDASFEIVVHEITGEVPHVIYSDSLLTVQTFPLVHRMPTYGFLFKEHQSLPNIRRDMIDFLHIPHYDIPLIKQGHDWTDADGRLHPHHTLVTPPPPSRAYAYCSDTMLCKRNLEILNGVDLLYHESTFLKADEGRARTTCHSTATDAATIANEANAKKLILGHFSARYKTDQMFLDEALPIFKNTILANEGLEISM